MSQPDQSLNMLSWNLQCGGFQSYAFDHEVPVRGKAIVDTINSVRSKQGIDVAILVDAYRWEEIYGG